MVAQGIKGYYKCKDQVRNMFREGTLGLHIILDTTVFSMGM
jgi:hypothetical protein